MCVVLLCLLTPLLCFASEWYVALLLRAAMAEIHVTQKVSWQLDVFVVSPTLCADPPPPRLPAHSASCCTRFFVPLFRLLGRAFVQMRSRITWRHGETQMLRWRPSTRRTPKKGAREHERARIKKKGQKERT